MASSPPLRACNSGTIKSGAVFITNSFDFSDVANVGGLGSGDIEITATNDFVNEGRIVADGAVQQNAGSIKITAGNNIAVSGDSEISAWGHSENSSGETIDIYAGQTAQLDG